MATTRWYESFEAAGDMGRLFLRTLRVALTPPFSWRKDAVEQFSTYSRREMIPLALSMAGYLIGYGVFFFGGVTAALGVGERLGGALYIAVVREIGVWVSTMIFAGVAGSAVAADLGSRKIREELDALSVLGVDQIRTLVVPRVVAMTLLAPLLGIIGIFLGTLAPLLVAPGLLGHPPEVYIYSIVHNIYVTDLISFTLKLTVVGLFVGIVSCQKGLSCKGGAEGVGRAVTQTVVISFFGIWLINSLWNLGYLTLFPETGVLKG